VSIFVVRTADKGLFLHERELCGCVARFKDAHIFKCRVDAEREREKYSSWREVWEVYWRVVWYDHGAPNPLGGKIERARHDSAKEAQASFFWRLAYGSGGSGDEVGFKVVRVLRRVRS